MEIFDKNRYIGQNVVIAIYRLRLIQLLCSFFTVLTHFYICVLLQCKWPNGPFVFNKFDLIELQCIVKNVVCIPSLHAFHYRNSLAF